MSKQLLTLCMIVKDEAHGIARTLRSVVPFVDRIVIVDTGSTDDTKAIVWEECDDTSRAIFDVPFVDFATTRNVLLQRATESWCDDHPTEFLLLLDADDVLEGGEALRAWLRGCEGDGERVPSLIANEGAFYVRMSEGSCEWSSARVVRASAVQRITIEPAQGREIITGPGRIYPLDVVAAASEGWRYVGAVHEVLVHPSGRVPTITIPGVHIRHERGPVSAERMRQRWERDVALLRAAVEKDPKDARATFYLARTLRQLGRNEEAREMFNVRIALGGWREEVFEALLERARLSGDPAQCWLKAHAHSPHRAEPLCDLAEYFRARDEHGPAFTFASRAAALPYPTEGLFIDGDVYRWKAAALVSISAWYVGEFEAGEAATRMALAGNPSENWQGPLLRNLRMYEERKAAR